MKPRVGIVICWVFVTRHKVGVPVGAGVYQGEVFLASRRM